VASFLDHRDVQSFRRASRAINKGACLGMLRNLDSFAKQSGDLRNSEDFIKLHMPRTLETLINHEPVIFEEKDVT